MAGIVKMMKRRKRFGELPHRKWHRGAVSSAAHWKKMSAQIRVARVGDTGERRAQPYRAIVCVGGSTRRGFFYPRMAASRCGEARGRTPTKAIRGAFRDLGKSFK